MSNKLFYKNEQAIFTAYYKFRDYPSAKRIAKHAGISRSTLHRHHKTAYGIPNDYEEYLLSIYSRIIKKHLNQDNFNLKKTYLRFLVFIMSNREVFKILFDENHKDIIKKMIHLFKPRIIAIWDYNGDLNYIFDIYGGAVLSIIEIWSSENFSDKSLAKTLYSIIYLTQNVRHALIPLDRLIKDRGDQV